MASTLLQTLRAASGRSESDTTNSGTMTSVAATAAQLKDGLDATVDINTAAGDLVNIGDGTERVTWAMDTLSIPAGSVIERVDIYPRAKRVGTLGTGNLNAVIGTTAISPGVGIGTSFADIGPWTRTTDPADGQPWTVARINGYVWGWLSTLQSVDNSHSMAIQVSEYRVEVWGFAGQTSTPSSIPMSIAEPAPAVAAGAVTSAPSAIAMTIAKPAPVVAAGPVGSALSSVGMSMEVVPFPADVLSQAAPANPQTVTSQEFLVARAETPAELGDADFTTGVGSALITSPGSGTLHVDAATMTNPVRAQDGAIDHVVFCANGQFDEGTWTAADADGGIMDDVTAQRIRYTTPAGTAAATITPFRFQGDSSNGGATRKTANLTTRPDGQPWTWADIDALTTVKAEADYTVPSLHVLHMIVNEVWVEIYGVLGTLDVVTTPGLKLGNIVLPQPIQQIITEA